jgi:hypothetical protein
MLKTPFIIGGLLAVVPSLIAGPRAKDSQCGAPTYKLALTYSQSPELIAIAISIKPRDVTVRNLLALACQLRADYQAQGRVGAEIFNDEQAAKHTTIHGVENSKGSNAAAYLASYHLDRQKGIETLTLAVDPNHPCDNDIQIDLKSKRVSIVSCK